VLELLATGAPLQTILESVVLGVEADNEDMLCSILLLDESGEHLLVGAAPSLPAFFNAAVHGKSISGAGACGEAVLTRNRVIVEDIRSAPSWASTATWLCRPGSVRAGPILFSAPAARCWARSRFTTAMPACPAWRISR
jgi:hypothetical protein